MNLFHSGWRGLLERGDFITALQTPIVKARPSKRAAKQAVKQAAKQAGDIEFYTLQDYERWAATEDNIENFNIKYYKGLGTSTPDEAKSYFRNMKLVSYSWDSEADDAMNLAFSKSKSDERKEWLQGYDKNNTIRWETKQGAAGTPAPVQVVRLADFVHKELIHYSHQNVMRSIPSLLDGLKPSQRKILHCVFKKKMTREIKVAQLAGYVSETRLLSSRRKQSSRCHCGIGARFHRFKQRAPFVAEGHVWISSSRRERCRIVEIYFHGVKSNLSEFISARRSVFGTKAI